MAKGYDWFGVGPPFDAQYRLVTSGFLPPFWLFLLRFIFAVYTLTANIVYLILDLNVNHEPANQYYAYFTHLSYIGQCAYFCASSFHTGFFTLNLRYLRHGDTSQGLWYPLQTWGKFLQAMHIYLYCTVITFAPLLTIVYWAILKDADTFSTPLNSWNNISFHALNTVFVVIEVMSCRVPMPWGYLPLCVITLGLYLGLAYLVHAVQDFYLYNFLNPANGKGHLAGYIVGIAVGGIVLFLIMWAVTKLRDWIFRRGRGVRVIDLSEQQSEKLRVVTA